MKHQPTWLITLHDDRQDIRFQVPITAPNIRAARVKIHKLYPGVRVVSIKLWKR